MKLTTLAVTAWTVGLMTITGVHLAQAQQPVRGAAAVLSEVERLRQENATLRAQVIGRDIDLASCYRHTQQSAIKYQQEAMELRTDLDDARLTKRAQELLPTLRELYQPEEGQVMDWKTGRFVTPKPKATPTPDTK